VAAPIRKVAPNAFLANILAEPLKEIGDALSAFDAPQVHGTLSAFGVVVSSTVPGILERAANSRAQIRRLGGVG
jgi:hypothetical protein